MDLQSISNAAANTVNPNLTVTVQRSTGYTVGDGYKQVPSYAAGVTGPAQIQALDSADLRQIEGLNLQGSLKAIYLRGALAGVVRPNSQGGDIVTVASPAPPQYIGTYLVVKVLESWPLFTKAVIQLQVSS